MMRGAVRVDAIVSNEKLGIQVSDWDVIDIDEEDRIACDLATPPSYFLIVHLSLD